MNVCVWLKSASVINAMTDYWTSELFKWIRGLMQLMNFCEFQNENFYQHFFLLCHDEFDVGEKWTWVVPWWMLNTFPLCLFTLLEVVWWNR